MTASTPDLIDLILSFMPDAAIVVDGDGLITSANPAMRGLFGYESGELIGQPVEVLLPERLRAGHQGRRRAFSVSPVPRAMGAGLELFGRRRDGVEFPVDISLAPHGLAGGEAVVAAIRDATAQREAEAVHSQLAAIVESSSDAIFTASVGGVIESWNPGAERILGYRSDEIVGTRLSRMIPEQALPEFEEQSQAAIRDELLGSRDSEWRRIDGRLLPVSVSVSSVRAARGELMGVSVTLRDITERKQAEEQLRHLLAEGDRHARWQAVMAEVRLHLLGGEELASVLELISDRLCELVDAKGAIGVISRPRRVVAFAGSARGLSLGLDLPETPGPGDGVRLIGPAELDPVLLGVLDAPVVMQVPIITDGDRAGYLLCGLAEAPTETEVTVAVSLADQAGLGIELDRARTDREQLLIGDERERIARDLHDLVIQRLFASGLTLQSVLPVVADQSAVDRIGGVVDELDETIREIRTTIFTLAPSPLASTGLRVHLLAVAADASRALGFEPSLRFEGPVDSAVGVVATAHIVAVVREALSNVARHAQASEVAVEVTTDGVDVTVVVRDDGVGIDETARQSGLRNLRTRAEEMSGVFEVGRQPLGGTRVEWRVPVSQSV